MSSPILSPNPTQCQTDAPAPDADDALRAARAARLDAVDALRMRVAAQLRKAAADYLLSADCSQSDPMTTYYLSRRAECNALADALELAGGAR